MIRSVEQRLKTSIFYSLNFSEGNYWSLLQLTICSNISAWMCRNENSCGFTPRQVNRCVSLGRNAGIICRSEGNTGYCQENVLQWELYVQCTVQAVTECCSFHGAMERGKHTILSSQRVSLNCNWEEMCEKHEMLQFNDQKRHQNIRQKIIQHCFVTLHTFMITLSSWRT